MKWVFTLFLTVLVLAASVYAQEEPTAVIDASGALWLWGTSFAAQS